MQWRLSLNKTEGQSLHENRVKHELRSPNFMLCGYLWRLRLLFPRGWTDSPGTVTMVLTCAGTQPEHAVDYQLVLQNQDDTENSVAKGGTCSRLQQSCNDLQRCVPTVCLKSVLKSCGDVLAGTIACCHQRLSIILEKVL
ncbi:TPA: hypothetical protein ACH3X1_016750 [Trebouxia sp. C0004]